MASMETTENGCLDLSLMSTRGLTGFSYLVLFSCLLLVSSWFILVHDLVIYYHLF